VRRRIFSRLAVARRPTGAPAALAAKAATTTISIIFEVADDLVRLGLVASLNRPGGNLTGLTSLNVEVAPKQWELLHEVIPAATIIALLVNPASPTRTESTTRDAQVATRRLGLRFHVLHATSERDFDMVFATFAQLQAGALVIGPDSFFFSRVEQLGTLTLRRAGTRRTPPRFIEPCLPTARARSSDLRRLAWPRLLRSLGQA
jgi:putative ABC transport system substrate-binding protein